MLDGIASDLRSAAVALRRRPAYAATAALTLALGVAAVATVWSLVSGVLLAPLPFPEAQRLVLVRERNQGGEWNTSVVDQQAIVEQVRSFEAVAAMQRRDVLLGGTGEPRWVQARFVTPRFFRTLGIAPAVGRAFADDDGDPGAARTVIIGAELARERFGVGAAVGRAILLDGEPYEIVGVMPEGSERVPVMRAELWPVLQLAPPERRGPFMLATIARLVPDASLETAREELAAVSARIFPLWSAGFQDRTAVLTPVPLRDVVVGGTGRFLWVAFAAVVVVLLIALVNVANLASMRAAERGKELSVRAALGADGAQLWRLQAAETLLLALAGIALGLVGARAMLDAYRALGPELPRLAEVALQPRTVLAFLALAPAISLALSWLPAHAAPSGALAGARGASADRGLSRMRDALVALEFALVVPLLVCAGLLLSSLWRLQQVDPGFETERLVTARLQLAPTAHPDGAERRAYWQRLRTALEASPGVAAVGFAGALPPDCGCLNNFELVGRPSGEGAQPAAPWVSVDAGYFAALGLPLVEGRGFAARDGPGAPPVVIVSESWAHRYFPDESAVGKQIYEGGGSDAVTVIGVVRDVHYDGLRRPGETVYAPISQGWPDNPTFLYLRSALAPDAQAAALGAALRRFDPALVPDSIAPAAVLLHDALGAQRHWAAVIASFATVAALLAAVGAFGVLAYAVARQRREIGIRMALGADKRRVLGLVMKRGLSAALAGTLVGVGFAAVATRGLGSLLFGVGALDPINLALACLVAVLVALLASWIPARRAAAIDPIDTLRYE